MITAILSLRDNIKHFMAMNLLYYVAVIATMVMTAGGCPRRV